MTTTSDRLGNQAIEIKKDLQEMGQTIRDGAQEKIGEVGEKASMYFDRGREGVYGVVRVCQRYVQQQPLRAVVIAVGVGWLAGFFWKRR